MAGPYEEISTIGKRLLDHGAAPEPPAGRPSGGARYPLAVDIDGRLGAVSFAVLDLHPNIAPGWWCVATSWVRGDQGWSEAGAESDNTTSPTPFQRPTRAENSDVGWCDWHSNGAAGHWGNEDDDPWRHVFFGIAPVGTARLVVTDERGRERDLRITPWNGAYVAVVSGRRSTLTGFDGGGNVLGSFMPMDGLPDSV